MVALSERPVGAWKPPVLTTVASDGTGIEELLATVDRFRAHQERSGGIAGRRLGRARREVEALALALLRRRLREQQAATLDELGRAVRDGELDPYAAAEVLLQRLPSG
jgi:LAO/AO transport system kinase